MSDTEPKANSLHNRTLSGLKDVIDRGLNYVDGFERIIVGRAVQILQPKVEQRIRQAPEEDLLKELKYLHDLLGNILQEPSTTKVSRVKAKSKRKRNK